MEEERKEGDEKRRYMRSDSIPSPVGTDVHVILSCSDERRAVREEERGEVACSAERGRCGSTPARLIARLLAPSISTATARRSKIVALTTTVSESVFGPGVLKRPSWPFRLVFATSLSLGPLPLP